MLRGARWMVFPLVPLLVALGLAAIELAVGQETLPASASGTGPAASLFGTVTVDSKQPAGKIVIYLESQDPDARFPVPADVVEVHQQGARFIPDFLVVARGRTVRLLNDEQGQIDHNAYSNSAALRFDLGLFGPGQSRDVVMESPGEISMFCSIHKYMEATMYVTPTPFFAVLEGPGDYNIAGVPPGEYLLKTWQGNKRLKNKSEAVSLQPGAAARLDLVLGRK